MIEVLLLLLIKPVKASPDWSISFENPDYCALNGSSVEFKCLYNYPEEETVRRTSWYKGELIDKIWTRTKLLLLQSYQNRSEYRGDLHHNCNLVLHDLQHHDAGYYYFRFDTNRYGRESQKAICLSVTGISARVYPQRVKVGDSVTLECLTSCQLPNIIWFKDGRPVPETEFQVQPDDAGRYSCTVEGHESVQSNSVALDVWYSPLNVSVEVSHGGPLMAGTSVNLTCNSAAKPPADVYIWYRDHVSHSSPPVQVGSEQILSFSPMNEFHNGLYFCQARNPVGKGNSSKVLLTLEEEGVDRFLHFGIGIIVILVLLLPLVVFLVWRRWRNSAANKEYVFQNDNHDYENVIIGECIK